MGLGTLRQAWSLVKTARQVRAQRAASRFTREAISEIHSEGELNLAIGAQSNGSLDGPVEHTERTSGLSRSERLSGLQRRSRAECVRQLRRWICKVRQVEDIEYFSSELNIRSLSNGELLGYDEVGLEESGSVYPVPDQITECARLRNGERRRVEDSAIFI